MRSGTSFFNGTVFKKTFLRFWPIWAASLAFWGMLLPVRGLMDLQDQMKRGGDLFVSFSAYVGDYGNGGAVIFAVIFGLLAAMAVCSHLYSARSANFMGALPVRREGLFLSHYLSGLAMLLAPNVVVFLLTLLVETAGGAVEWIPLLFWLGALSGAEFFFYSFAVCVGMFAGHLLALPVFYGVFNALAMAARMMWVLVMRSFYYGYAGDFRLTGLVLWLTPVVRLSEQLDCNAYGYASKGFYTYEIRGLTGLGVYALAGAALAVCALLLYRRRHLETAGDVVAVKVMRPVFKYGVAVCAGLSFGVLTTGILGAKNLGLMVAIVLWGIVGYFVAQMLLDKSFRVFRKWKGAAAVTAVFLALFLVAGFDLTGFETRVPDAADVVSVEISGLRSMPYDDGAYMGSLVVDDPETIGLAVAFHQAAVDHRKPEAKDGANERMTVTLSYQLSGGAVLEREYDLRVYQEDSGQPGTVAWAVENLLADRDLVWQGYGFDRLQSILAEGGRLSGVAYTENRWEEQDYFYGENAAALWEAVKADFADGAIGVRVLWEEARHPDRALTFTAVYAVDSVADFPECTVEIAVADTAARTLAALEELGALESP